MAILGYIRGNSQHEMNEKYNQVLLNEGVDHIYYDEVHGLTPVSERKGLSELIKNLNKGDVVIVPSVERLSRDSIQLLEILGRISDKGATIKFLTNIKKDVKVLAGDYHSNTKSIIQIPNQM